MRIIVTGGLGFIGSTFVRYLLDKEEDEIIVFDYAGYASSRNNLPQSHPKLALSYRSINDNISGAFNQIDAVVNFAAETHVDNSILDSYSFIRSNIAGTHNLLDIVRRVSPSARFLQVSTDEVYGDKREGFSKETDIFKPSSPYAASKAAAEHLVFSYARTYGLDVVVTRGSNTYGPMQYPEKLIPVAINKLLADEPVPLYAGGFQQRQWLYVYDHVLAIDLVLRRGISGEAYNVGGNSVRDNRSVINLLISKMGKDPNQYVETVQDRLGHDVRYAIDSTKLNKLGWTPYVSLNTGLEVTIDFYKHCGDWWAK